MRPTADDIVCRKTCSYNSHMLCSVITIVYVYDTQVLANFDCVSLNLWNIIIITSYMFLILCVNNVVSGA